MESSIYKFKIVARTAKKFRFTTFRDDRFLDDARARVRVTGWVNASGYTADQRGEVQGAAIHAS
jgi:hypothetical protein